MSAASEFSGRVVAALGENMGVLAPAIKQLMAEAWAEGADAGYNWACVEGIWQEPNEVAPVNPYLQVA